MRIQDRNGHAMFGRVQNFGALHASDFPPASRGGQAFAELNALLPGLEHHAAIQSGNSGSSRVGTATRATLRAALRETMNAFHITARAIGIETPGLENQFRVPSGGDQVLLDAARASLDNATPLKAKFIEHEMPDDFLDQLRGEIDDFQAAVAEQTRSAQARLTATATLDSLMEQGHTIVQRLDAIVRNKYRGNRPMLSVWESATHIERHNPRATDSPKQDPEKLPGTVVSPTD